MVPRPRGRTDRPSSMRHSHLTPVSCQMRMGPRVRSERCVVQSTRPLCTQADRQGARIRMAQGTDDPQGGPVTAEQKLRTYLRKVTAELLTANGRVRELERRDVEPV